jgi:2,3-dihydroxybenzoate decarboxylase
MSTDNGTQIIAIEEHYIDPEVDELTGGRAGGSPVHRARQTDLGEKRLADMDEAGIDIQVLSHGPSGAQAFTEDTAVDLAVRVNDRLKAIVDDRPDRFDALAILPSQVPKAAADELERAIDKLGFKGAMMPAMTDRRFHDREEFWPIFERAAALDVPIYIHPGPPHPAMVEAYLEDYAEEYSVILGPAWGFTIETATAGLRLVLSGIFEAYPNLQIILGHLGEGLPFLIWRINHSLAGARRTSKALAFKDIFCGHFHITTSGNFSDPALLCSVMEMGAERILFSVDWPFIENAPGTAWMEQVPLGPADREKILSGNAKRLLKI